MQIPRAIAGKFADAREAHRRRRAGRGRGKHDVSNRPKAARATPPGKTAATARRGARPTTAPAGKPKVHRKGKHPHNANRPPKTYSDRKPRG